MDFTKYLNQQIPRFYGGSNGNKKAIKLEDGTIYMLKFPPTNKDNKKISYTNSSISEYISCQIIKSMGIEVQDTILGKVIVDGKEKIVVACKDFTQNGEKLYEFAMVKNGCIGSSNNGYGTELQTVLSAIEEQNIYNPIELKKYFWDLFILDSLLGNFDRHNGNWGFLVDEQEKIRVAPIYDCGSCLYPQLDDETIKEYLQKPKELEARVYVFPNSSLKENEQKINYYDYISSLKNEDCNQALIRIYQKIDLNRINEIIDNTPYITNERKEFYKIMIQKRYEDIIQYGYEKLTK